MTRRLESGVDPQDGPKAREEQSRAGEQDEGEGDLYGGEHALARSPAGRSCPPRPSSRNSSNRSRRRRLETGATPSATRSPWSHQGPRPRSPGRARSRDHGAARQGPAPPPTASTTSRPAAPTRRRPTTAAPSPSRSAPPAATSPPRACRVAISRRRLLNEPARGCRCSRSRSAART